MNKTYFAGKESTFYSSINEEGGAAAVLKPPLLIEEDGREYELSEDNEENRFLAVKEEIEDLGRGLFHIRRTFCNQGKEKRSCKLVLEVETLFSPDRYLIPCVNYNGNSWGEGREPKGLTADNGEAWIFAYDREGIPSASVTENEKLALALFTDSRTRESLRSAVSLLPGEKGQLRQRIYYPVTEAPYTYSDNDTYTESYEEYFQLQPGERITLESYLLLSVPPWKNYGVCGLLDRMLELQADGREQTGTARTEMVQTETNVSWCLMEPKEIWRTGILFAKTLMSRGKDGRVISSTGMRLNPATGEFVKSEKAEIGWCGQNLMSARMQLLEYTSSKDRECLDNALGILESWTDKQADNGLILSHYNWYTNGKEWDYVPRDKSKSWASNINYDKGWLPEACNMGWAASEMIKNYKLLYSMGIDRPRYKVFACKICDFFAERFSPEYGFGKSWRFDGTAEETEGSIGIFVTLALLEVYQICGEERYLEAGRKSLDFYVHRDLEQFVCTAGAIDCTCVDKETAGPFLTASLNLYEITGEEKYLTYSKWAAYYFTSWMYHYEADYPRESDFSRYGYSTLGGTAVSVQHPALDPWGELIVPEFLRLYHYTGDRKWKKRAALMWQNAIQLIASEESRKIHGQKRPVGSQNEAYFHCRWSHRKDCNDRGHLNDWLVAWVDLFRLSALEKMYRLWGKEEIEELYERNCI